VNCCKGHGTYLISAKKSGLGSWLAKLEPTGLPTEKPRYGLLPSARRRTRGRTACGLLFVAKILNQQNHIFELLIIGDGPERSSLEEFAHWLQISSIVRFAGHLKAEELEKFSIVRVVHQLQPMRSMMAGAMLEFADPRDTGFVLKALPRFHASNPRSRMTLIRSSARASQVWAWAARLPSALTMRRLTIGFSKVRKRPRLRGMVTLTRLGASSFVCRAVWVA